jgi:TusA-related sulfurtransferase
MSTSQPTLEDVWRLFQETDRLLKQQAQEAERRSQETDRKLQELGKQIGRLGGAWGRFVEDLVAPACEGLFLKRGIPVERVSQRVKRYHQGETLEIDVLVVNQGHVLAVEAKSSLSVEDVKNFITDLNRFGTFFPEYAQDQIYGAVAGIGIESQADVYASRQGLFALTESGDGIRILNPEGFVPKAW